MTKRCWFCEKILYDILIAICSDCETRRRIRKRRIK